jgi:spore maturation protein CgeB
VQVLLLGSHLGYNLEYYVKAALERLGCDVKFVGYREYIGRLATPVRFAISRSARTRQIIEPLALRKFNEVAKRIAVGFSPQVCIVIKGEAVLPEAIDWFSQQLGAITALWYPDDPRYFQSLSKLIAPYYDFVFTSSERFVSTYRDIGVDHVRHLPFACEPDVHRPITLSPDERERLACDICFVGTFSRRRARIIQALETARFRVNVWGSYWRYFKWGANVKGPISGPEMVRVFNAAKIVLNVHDPSDLSFKPNMRVFEATGCQSFLLTDRALGLDTCFDEPEEVTCYDDDSDLVQQSKSFLESPSERASIAQRAHERAYKEHTYDQRIDQVLRTVAKGWSK